MPATRGVPLAVEMAVNGGGADIVMSVNDPRKEVRETIAAGKVIGDPRVRSLPGAAVHDRRRRRSRDDGAENVR